MPTLDERIAELRERRLVLLQRRAELTDAAAFVAAQTRETEKALHATEGALEFAHALKAEEAPDGV